MTLEALLTRHGYQTETATTATLGLRAMKTNPAALVLLDLELPDAAGLDTVDRPKKDFVDSQTIFLTANDSLINAIQTFKRGGSHFTRQPYQPGELFRLP